MYSKKTTFGDMHHKFFLTRTAFLSLNEQWQCIDHQTGKSPTDLISTSEANILQKEVVMPALPQRYHGKTVRTTWHVIR